MNSDRQACESFQAELASGLGLDQIYSHPHLKNCELCRELLIDLDRIAEGCRNRKRE